MTSTDFLSFDDVQDTRPTIADGEYVLRVVSPSLRDKNDKTGKYINYDAVVQEGPEAGYRIFQNVFSLAKDNAWRFKAALKAVGFAIPKGLTLEEAAAYFVQNANGFEFVGSVGKKSAQAKNEAGVYVNTEGQFNNQVKRWLKAVV